MIFFHAEYDLWITAIPGIILFVVLLWNFIPKNSTQSSSALFVEDIAVLSDQEKISVGSPARFKNPIIEVDAPVEDVGLTSDGAMDVPKGPVEVAWFDLGPRPGEIGSAVIAGHYGWTKDISAVFDNLYKLQIGDKIFVEDEEGAIVIFVVRETRIYGKDDIDPEVFGSNDGKAHLNLVTCTGDWDNAERTRSHRLVIFTDKE